MIDALLREWEQATGAERPGLPTPDVAALRCRLIEEECDEVADELLSGVWNSETSWFAGRTSDEVDRAKLAKELADLVYVVYGTAYQYDIPLTAVVEEVHRSNMTKIKGGVVRREDGKILKGPHYEEADVARVLDERK